MSGAALGSVRWQRHWVSCRQMLSHLHVLAESGAKAVIGGCLWL